MGGVTMTFYTGLYLFWKLGVAWIPALLSYCILLIHHNRKHKIPYNIQEYIVILATIVLCPIGVGELIYMM